MKTSSSHPSSLLANRPTEHNKSEQVSQARGESEWQRNAIRICGNWSEQLSSKGRVYFYNCITEVSQWQKPGEWTLPDFSKKELHKIVNERRGSDVHSVKRTYSSLTQTERTRLHPQDVSSSPKRQKCHVDTSKLLSERLKNESIEIHRSDPSNVFRDNCLKVENTVPSSSPTPLKQTADIRESLGSILCNESLSISSIDPERINATSRVTDEGSTRSSSSLCPNISTSLNACRKMTEVVTCCSNNTIQSSRQSTSGEHTASNLSSQLTALVTLLNTTTAATTTQSFGDASRFNRSPRYGVSSTSSSSRFNHRHPATISQSPSPHGSGLICIDRSSQGDACNRQVSDFVSRLGSFVNHEKEAENEQGNSNQPSNFSKPTMSLLPNPPSTNCLPHIHDRRNFLPCNRSARLGPVNPIHRDPGGQQKPNVLRNLVTALHQVVNARRDRNSASTTPGNHRTPPTHTPNQTVDNMLTSLLETQKSSNGRPFIGGTSPGNKGILNGSAFFRGDTDGKQKSVSEGLLGPPSSDGVSIINSPSCTRTSPHFSSPGMCTASCADSRHVHPGGGFYPSNCAPDGGDGSFRMLADRYPVVSLNDRHERFAKSFFDNLEAEKQKLDASILILECPDLQRFVDPTLTSKFQHTAADNLENEAQCEFRKFDRLHSVLYSELSGEQKKLRALAGISETKLKIHQKRKEALQDLMDALETRRPRPSLISSDPGI